MRDFDTEAEIFGSRLYNYEFDDIVRHYALQTFLSHVRPGPALEMGCHEGGMSRLLAPHFSDLTVIDAAKSALDIAKAVLPSDVAFVVGEFETVQLSRKFDSIFMINVLEHVDDAVLVLRRAAEWLTDSGRLFLLVPNANAPSRQIAVQMGLITHHQAVTDAERKNGHRRTYALDTFHRDLRNAGLNVEHTGGIIFKGLANYQMDKALAAGIITMEYLAACFELGKMHPDFCASLFAVCSKKKQVAGPN